MIFPSASPPPSSRPRPPPLRGFSSSNVRFFNPRDLASRQQDPRVDLPFQHEPGSCQANSESLESQLVPQPLEQLFHFADAFRKAFPEAFQKKLPFAYDGPPKPRYIFAP